MTTMPPVPDFTGTYTLDGPFPRVCMRRTMSFRSLLAVRIVCAKIGLLSAELFACPQFPALQAYIYACAGTDLQLCFHGI